MSDLKLDGVETDLETSAEIRRGLDAFVAGDFGRASEVHESTWLRDAKNKEGFRDNVKEVFVSWLDEAKARGTTALTAYKALTYFCDTLDGFETFDDSSLADLQKRLAVSWIKVIESLMARGETIETIMKDQIILRGLFYIVGMKNYLPVEHDAPKLLEILRSI
jgi:hypothetical protein